MIRLTMKKNLFILYLFISSVFALHADNGEQPKKTIFTHINSWWNVQQQRARENKMQRDAPNVVGPVASKYNINSHDRNICREILTDLSEAAQKPNNGHRIFKLKQRGGYDTYALTPLREKFKKCKDLDAVIEVVDTVYQESPSLQFYTIKDNHSSKFNEALDGIINTIQLVQEVGQLTKQEKLELIKQLNEHGNGEIAQAIDSIYNMKKQQRKALLYRLVEDGSKLQKHGIVTTDWKRWNNDFSSWLSHCAQSLESDNLPSERQIQQQNEDKRKFETEWNRIRRLRSYDYALRSMKKNCDHIHQETEDTLEQSNYPSQRDYQVLGVSKTTSLEEIKRKRRKLTLKNHPDKGGDAKVMAPINDAYGRIKNLHEHHERINDIEFCHWLDHKRNVVFNYLLKLQKEKEAHYRAYKSNLPFRSEYYPPPSIASGERFPYEAFGISRFKQRENAHTNTNTRSDEQTNSSFSGSSASASQPQPTSDFADVD